MVVGKLNVVSQVAECRKLVADRLTDVRNRHVVVAGGGGGGGKRRIGSLGLEEANYI